MLNNFRKSQPCLVRPRPQTSAPAGVNNIEQGTGLVYVSHGPGNSAGIVAVKLVV